jgi:hypothetical protein
MHYIVHKYFILQHHVENAYVFRHLTGSSSGNHIKVTLLKTELALIDHSLNQLNQKCVNLKTVTPSSHTDRASLRHILIFLYNLYLDLVF